MSMLFRSKAAFELPRPQAWKRPIFSGPFTARNCHQVSIDSEAHTEQEVIDYLYDIGAPGLLAVQQYSYEDITQIGPKTYWSAIGAAIRVRATEPSVIIAVKLRFKLSKNQQPFKRDVREKTFRTSGSTP